VTLNALGLGETLPPGLQLFAFRKRFLAWKALNWRWKTHHSTKTHLLCGSCVWWQLEELVYEPLHRRRCSRIDVGLLLYHSVIDNF
jgi:hypothetical protein